jgi:hypothetical protein
MAQQSTQSSGPEILIIRADRRFSWWGEGLYEHLQSKGRNVVDLGPIDERMPEKRATQRNIEKYLEDWSPDCVRKLVVFFGHSTAISVWSADERDTITRDNCGSLTRDLHFLMFSCFTGNPCENADIKDEKYQEACTRYGLGREAVERGECYSWYGFTDFFNADKDENVLSIDNSVIYSKIRRGLWAYVDALVDRKTVEEAEDSLVKGLLKARDEIDALREDFDIDKKGWEIIQKIKKKTIDEFLLQGRLYKRGNGLRLDSHCRPGTIKIMNGPTELFNKGQMLLFLKGWWATRLGSGVRYTEPTSQVKISDGRVINVRGNETSVNIVFNDPGTYTWALESEVKLYDATGRLSGKVDRRTVERGLLKVVVAPKEIPDVITPPSCQACPALIQSDFGASGNFEVVLWEASSLRHYWRDSDLPNLPWHQGPLFGENIASAPALIQSSFGNFEVVVREGSRLRHYYRDNNAPGLPWHQGSLFGENIASAPALIQSSFGNFEVVVREGSRLRHYYRDNNAPGLPWHQGSLFGENIASAPALIQSSFGNFEVVVREGMQLRHYWRDNNAPNLPWWPGGLFGKTIQSAASLVQAKLGGTGNNFHVAAIEFIAGEYLAYDFCRDTSQGGDGLWVRTQPIGMVGKWIVSSRPV